MGVRSREIASSQTPVRNPPIRSAQSSALGARGGSWDSDGNSPEQPRTRSPELLSGLVPRA
eukprot:14528640-Alexandrium_andersonii.AAC.1